MTVTAATYTTTSTSVSTSYLPTSTYTSTAYTVSPAGPTLASSSGSARGRSLGEDARKIVRQEAALLKRSLRKIVKCTPIVQSFRTLAAAKTTTVSVTSTIYPTITNAQIVTGVVTSTSVPAAVNTVVVRVILLWIRKKKLTIFLLLQTVAAAATITANTITFTTTPTQVATTTVLIQLQPVQTVTKNLVTICNPNKATPIKKQVVYDFAGFSYYSNQGDSFLNNLSDEPTCCSAAALISGAFAYGWIPQPGVGGNCQAGYQTDASATSCGASTVTFVDVDTISPQNQEIVGILQCGSEFNVNSVTLY
jgi:hypothetical protein